MKTQNNCIYLVLVLCKKNTIFHMNICEVMYVSIYLAQHASQMEDIKVHSYSEIIKNFKN